MLAEIDRIAIQDLINMYHYYVDEPGFPRLRDVFTADCVFDASAYGGGVSRGIAELAARFAGASGVLAHSCTNIVLTEETTVSVRCISKCLASIPDGKIGMAIHKDVLRRTPDGWRIAERVLAPASLS
jgi:hypothetical protein